MTHRPKTLSFIGLIIVVFVAWAIWQWVAVSTGPGPYDAFAQCIKEKKTVFYGAFWCPHCQVQKDMFGKSARYLPYMECSLPNGQGQTPVCEQKGIKGYPTWEFADGSRLAGEVKLQTLSERTGCPLPEGT